MSAKVHDYIQPVSSPNGQKTAQPMPNSYQDEGWLGRYFLPQPETKIMPEQPAKGLFIPWPLLAIIVTLAIVLVSGLIALEVQVSNLNTTLLLRDADQRAEIMALKEKAAQLEVYIHSDREKLVDIQTTLREADKRSRARTQ